MKSVLRIHYVLNKCCCRYTEKKKTTAEIYFMILKVFTYIWYSYPYKVFDMISTFPMCMSTWQCIECRKCTENYHIWRAVSLVSCNALWYKECAMFENQLTACIGCVYALLTVSPGRRRPYPSKMSDCLWTTWHCNMQDLILWWLLWEHQIQQNQGSLTIGNLL